MHSVIPMHKAILFGVPFTVLSALYGVATWKLVQDYFVIWIITSFVFFVLIIFMAVCYSRHKPLPHPQKHKIHVIVEHPDSGEVAIGTASKY